MKTQGIVLAIISLVIPFAVIHGQSKASAGRVPDRVVALNAGKSLPEGYYRLAFHASPESLQHPIFDTIILTHLASSNLKLPIAQARHISLSALNEFLRSTSGVFSAAKEPNDRLLNYRVTLSMRRGSITSEGRISVSIAYDPQPIGGILSLCVDLVPMFSGVGISNRPFASEHYASAVSEFNPDQITTLTLEMIEKLERSLAAME